MEDTATLTFKVKRFDDNRELPIMLEVRLDGEAKYSREVPFEEETVSIAFSDAEAEHTLEIEMSGKTYAHTKLAEDGTVVSDTAIEVYDFCLEDIEIGYNVTSASKYVHSYNNPDPNAEIISEQFNNNMGCNGVATFKFSTPAFIWLLENV